MVCGIAALRPANEGPTAEACSGTHPRSDCSSGAGRAASRTNCGTQRGPDDCTADSPDSGTFSSAA